MAKAKPAHPTQTRWPRGINPTSLPGVPEGIRMARLARSKDIRERVGDEAAEAYLRQMDPP